MARFLLDTQAFLILYENGLEGLSRQAKALLTDQDNEFLLSSVSCSEIAIKASIGKFTFTAEEISRAVTDLRLTMIPYTPAHANRLFTLPLHHRDPFDRMLVATALAENIPLIGADKEFKKYRGLKVIW